jgi:hypothetical protein
VILYEIEAENLAYLSSASSAATESALSAIRNERSARYFTFSRHSII